MTDDPDDEALSWAGDEPDLVRPGRPVVAAPVEVAPAEPRSALTLLLLGVLGGVAVLETLGWLRGVLSVTLESTLEAGRGPLGTAAFGLNVLTRVVAVTAPLLWFALAAWRIRRPSRRAAWLVLGAVVLLPWPALLGLA